MYYSITPGVGNPRSAKQFYEARHQKCIIICIKERHYVYKFDEKKC